MCGFVGFLGGVARDGQAGDAAILKRMSDTLVLRGPDDGGHWSDTERRIGFGHRRLAVVDLSPAGHQPMHSASGRYVIAFNGEIYNHLLLREELAGAGLAPHWRGHSDTETLLAAFDAWGIEGTLERANGMFAFGLWDRQRNELTLARDRIGEKPLYYGWQGRGADAVFLFGSELKALRAHPAFDNLIDRNALSLQLRHNYIPAPYSIYVGISKLTPGALLTVSLAERGGAPRAYWSGSRIASDGAAARFAGSPDEAVDQLEILLKDAIGRQMVADVPLGAFLSGGIDSSTIVALMQQQSSRPVKTFTIGFNEQGYDEATHARAVAHHLGTEHTELYVTPAQAMDVIPRLPGLYDEPFSDASQIPTYLVSQLAREHVTVSLSGDAGDELFCGYDRYAATDALWRKLGAIPAPLRGAGAALLTSISPAVLETMCALLGPLAPAVLRQPGIGDKLHKGAALMSSTSCDDLYRRMVSHWQDPAALVLGAREPATQLTGRAPPLDGLNAVERMMALDMLTYLPDDILVKVDRAAMGVSLETRVPFLDRRVVEFAWQLPQAYKMRSGTSKWVLREVLFRHVPKALIERPKMGFGVPIGDWLRGPLRAWAETLLEERRLRDEGFFDPAPIRKKWHEHVTGQRSWERHLWDVLMFQAWLESQ